jgi:hypothetical protein
VGEGGSLAGSIEHTEAPVCWSFPLVTPGWGPRCGTGDLGLSVEGDRIGLDFPHGSGRVERFSEFDGSAGYARGDCHVRR